MHVPTMEGLWTVEFGSSAGVFGGGVVVLQNGKVMGGDAGYYYLGDYRLDGNAFHASIRISAFNLGDHLKTGQVWSGQNRPMEAVRD